MKISCLMPTYGRPTLVQNAIACFLAQDYPAQLRRLLILDDAGQIAPQSGEGWRVWSTPRRMETLTAKYAKLNTLDGGWADAFVIWDDDDIYLPWHLSEHAVALRNAQWSYPTTIWTLNDGLQLCRTDGRFWASSAVRVDLLRSLNGFIQSAVAHFDQLHLRAWRDRGGEPGQSIRPSYIYGWGRSNHVSRLMARRDETAWYNSMGMLEPSAVDRIAPKMDAQTRTIFAALAPAANPCTTDNGELEDAYEVTRALLCTYEMDDRGAAISEGRRILARVSGAQRLKLWNELVEESEYHGVVPLLEPIISALAKDIPNTVPEDIRRTFVALASRHRRAAHAREQCIDRLLVAFADADIPLILLKGAALAHLIYPAPELRPMIDIDVLIDRKDIDCAIEIVCGLGYRFARYHESYFAGRMHHLPPASTAIAGFEISLEVHVDAMSPNISECLDFATVSKEAKPFQRGSGPPGFALGHADMLHHLARHTFEPARRVRLKHLYDLQKYKAKFTNEIDWDQVNRRFPHVLIALRLASIALVSLGSEDTSTTAEHVPTGVGHGMEPLSEIANMPFYPMLGALFNPSAWWLHGFYGVPLDRSLLICRTIRHPLMLARWFVKRIMGSMIPQRPLMLPKKPSGQASIVARYLK